MKAAYRMPRIFRLTVDDSLTKKASLNALAAVLDYTARLLVTFVTTPLMVAGLGAYFFGTWQVLNRLLGYITPASGRPTQALKFTIARDQSSTDYELKQKYVGSALIVWGLFLPVMIVLGAFLVWMVPYWLKTPPQHFWPVRVCIGILVANLAMDSVTTIPMSVLQGENLGYKRMGLTTATVLLGGGLVWLALHFETGLIGVGGAALATTVLTGIVFYTVTQKYASWFKVSVPSFRQVRQFLGLSFWFQGWNLVMNLLTASDVVILGILVSAEAVTDYSLSKYAPETLISIIAMMVFGMAPGLGGIIGAGQVKKAADIRGEIMALTWLAATALGATILAWNRPFLALWVGPGHYVGPWPALLIILVVTQFVLIRSDAVIIDLSLNLRRKVLIGLVSAAVAIVVSGVLVGYFKLGLIGLCLGVIAGRMLLSVEYPLIVGRFLGVAPASQLRSCLRPALVTAVLYASASWLGSAISVGGPAGLGKWLGFAGGAGITAAAFLGLSFYWGLSGHRRRTLLLRLRAVLSGGARQTD